MEYYHKIYIWEHALHSGVAYIMLYYGDAVYWAISKHAKEPTPLTEIGLCGPLSSGKHVI